MEMIFFDSNIDINAVKQAGRRVGLGFLPLMLVLLLTLSLPKQGYSQTFNPLISFSVESCTLDAALEKLFAEYELNVAFSKAEMSKIRIEKYTCSYKSVDDVLTDLLKGTDYGYKRIGKQYVIKKNQQLANDLDAIVTPPAETSVEVTKPKPDVVVSKTGDTIRVFDTLRIIRTVMRYDTIVEVKHEVRTDTVYEVKYEQIPLPAFRGDGWFIMPSVSLGAPLLKHSQPVPEIENGSMEVLPSSAFGIGLDAGYKYNRLSVGASLSYRSMRYRFMLEQTVFGGDYHVSDTLDSYYTIHPTGDTTYHYILDSTYIPETTTHHAYRDVNRLDYLTVGLFAAFDFVRLERFRAFVKAGLSIDFLTKSSGSFVADESPFHQPIDKSLVEPVRFSYYGGLGVAFKIGNQVELVPEAHYRVTSGTLYRADYPFDIRLRSFDFRLGLTYYF